MCNRAVSIGWLQYQEAALVTLMPLADLLNRCSFPMQDTNLCVSGLCTNAAEAEQSAGVHTSDSGSCR